MYSSVTSKPVLFFSSFLLLLLGNSQASSNKSSVVADFPFFFRIYKDGHVERLIHGSYTPNVPPGLDPETKVLSKDVIYSPQINQSLRIYYVPVQTKQAKKKLPLLINIHGGGYCCMDAAKPNYHHFMNKIVSESNGAIGVSINYRLAPEHPLPIPFKDSWAAFKWIASHANGHGPEQLLNRHVDFNEVVLIGDSAGAAIATNLGIRHAEEKTKEHKVKGVNVKGLVLFMPWLLGGKGPVNETNKLLFKYLYPGFLGVNDPLLNPAADGQKLATLMRSSNVFIVVAGRDPFRGGGLNFYNKAVSGGWKRKLQLVDYKDEGHVFYLSKPTTKNAISLRKRVIQFVDAVVTKAAAPTLT